jgi:hypothetical protein
VSEKDKAQIMAALSDLPEEKKQFVLGYAAGIAAKSDEKAEPKKENGMEEKHHG